MGGGGLVMMTSTPAEKACEKRAGVMVLASIGMRGSHPEVASGGGRGEGAGCVAMRGDGMWRYVRLGPVAMPSQSSTRWMGLWGRWYLGMVTREECVEPSLGGGLGGPRGLLGGVYGGMVAGQAGMGLVGLSEGGGGGSASPCQCVREEFDPLRRQLADVAYGRCKDLVDAV
jgi:hypothetical protein